MHSYLDSTANEFVVKLSGDIPFRTREDIITDLKFALARLENCLKQENLIDENIIKLLIHPEIGYTLNCENHSL